MSTTQSSVQILPDSSGKKVDTALVTQADGTSVHRESVVVSDPELAAAQQRVSLDGETLSRNARLEDLLQQILVELRVANAVAHSTLGCRDDLDALRAIQ